MEGFSIENLLKILRVLFKKYRSVINFPPKKYKGICCGIKKGDILFENVDVKKC